MASLHRMAASLSGGAGITTALSRFAGPSVYSGTVSYGAGARSTNQFGFTRMGWAPPSRSLLSQSSMRSSMFSGSALSGRFFGGSKRWGQNSYLGSRGNLIRR